MKKGFTLLFGLLLMALLLTIAMSILSLSTKQLAISTAGQQSQVAFYAADSGVECVKYWDQVENAFATTTAQPSIMCAGQTIPIVQNDPQTYACPTWNGTCVKRTVSFSLVSGLATGPGTDVTVYKDKATDETEIDSSGHDIYDTSAPNREERAVALTYTPTRPRICTTDGDVMVLEDVSNSVSVDDSNYIAQGLSKLVTQLFDAPSNIEVGVVMFGTSGMFRYHLTPSSQMDTMNLSAWCPSSILPNPNDLSSAKSPCNGATDMQGGIRLARYEFHDLVPPPLNNGQLTTKAIPAVSSPLVTACDPSQSDCYNRTPDSAHPNFIVMISDGAPHGFHDDTNDGAWEVDGAYGPEGSPAYEQAAALEALQARNEGTAIYTIFVNSTSSSDCVSFTGSNGVSSFSAPSNDSCGAFLAQDIAGPATGQPATEKYAFEAESFQELPDVVARVVNCN